MSERAQSHWSLVNWSLPNWMIAQAWGLFYASPANYRSRSGLPPSPYLKESEVDGSWRELFEAEKLKAQQYRAHRPQMTSRNDA